MLQAKVVIVNTYGFHVRPTTRFIEISKQHSSKVEIEKDGIRVEAKGPMALLSLGVMKGDEITIICTGPDEEATLNALVALVESRFGGIE